MKNSLATSGLSLSQAQSISNMCYQRAIEITNGLSGINNAQRTLKIDKVDHIETVGKKIPADVAKLLLEKAKLHATQAFLMTNIKAKDQLLQDLQRKSFISKAEIPMKDKMVEPKLIDMVDESWGWDQLSTSETCEFLEQEAYAAHIGQFIHKDSILDKLRRQLPTIKTLEWIDVKVGEKTPLIVTPHHTSEELLKHHEELATLHRKFEMRVNYFKAKVKNLITEENARISKENAIEQGVTNNWNNITNVTYTAAVKAYQDEVAKEREEFEGNRQDLIKETAQLRIAVDARFQDVVALYLKDLEEPKA